MCIRDRPYCNTFLPGDRIIYCPSLEKAGIIAECGMDMPRLHEREGVHT